MQTKFVCLHGHRLQRRKEVARTWKAWKELLAGPQRLPATDKRPDNSLVDLQAIHSAFVHMLDSRTAGAWVQHTFLKQALQSSLVASGSSTHQERECLKLALLQQLAILLAHQHIASEASNLVKLQNKPQAPQRLHDQLAMASQAMLHRVWFIFSFQNIHVFLLSIEAIGYVNKLGMHDVQTAVLIPKK